MQVICAAAKLVKRQVCHGGGSVYPLQAQRRPSGGGVRIRCKAQRRAWWPVGCVLVGGVYNSQAPRRSSGWEPVASPVPLPGRHWGRWGA
jgi:hypothetical protein